MGTIAAELAELTDERLTELPRERSLGELDFSRAAGYLRTAVETLRALDAEPIDQLPDETVSAGNRYVSDAKSLIERMEGFSLSEQNSQATWQGYNTEASNIKNQVQQTIRPQIRATEVHERLSSAELDQLVQVARDARDEVLKVADAARAAAGELGASQLSSHYGSESNARARTARWFLIAAMLTALALLGAAIWLLTTVHVDTKVSSSQEWVELVRNLVVRLAFLGLISYALSFCVRGYRSNTHLSIMNRQKKVALDTYPLFFDAASVESEARDLITAALVQTVFTPADTGMLDASGDRTIIEGQGSQLLTALVARKP